MLKTPFRKIAALLIAILLIGVIWYLQLSNRHKAIVKTVFFHKTGLVDSQWNVDKSQSDYEMTSPEFYIDGIYTSMEGPKSSQFAQLSRDSTVVWIKGFNVKAVDSKTGKQISNDFICHTNVDMNDYSYYGNFNLKDRIGKQYPRMVSLSHGMEHFEFPKGYGIPIKGNEYLYVTTETLNHNIPDANFLVRHKIGIDYSKTALKPLMSLTAFIMLPYDKNDPFKGPLDPGTNQCIPVETKNHSYLDKNGNPVSGHWVIPTGKKIYRSSIDEHLQLKDSLRLHAAAVHVHPFATSIELRDRTSGQTVFKRTIVNFKNKTGISSIKPFISEDGIWLYKNHNYELILETNNTSGTEQDMMGSTFLFFYDKELDDVLQQKNR